MHFARVDASNLASLPSDEGFGHYPEPLHGIGAEQAYDGRTRPSGSVYTDYGLKRGFDIVVASLALLFFAPVMLVIALALFLQDGAPLFYRQNRIGNRGMLFGCLKFRSMVRDSETQLRTLLANDEAAAREWRETQKLERDPRIHPLGHLLRKSSLDELPQLINVLKGEMSIVGPRPIVADEVARYRDSFGHYQSVRPGLTGLWQVSGRNTISYDRRVELDVAYVNNIAFQSDLMIVLKTIWVVIAGRGR